MLLFGPVVCHSNPYAGGTFQVFGVATTSCGKYISHFNDVRWKVLYRNWVTGFMTGVNYSSKDIDDISGGLDSDALLKFIYNYCEENPLKTVSDGAHYLVQELYDSGAYSRSSSAGN